MYTLRDATLPDDLGVLLDLNDAATRAANLYVYGGDGAGREFRAALVEHGLAEYAPPYARLLVTDDRDAAGVGPVRAPAPGARRRLSAALAFRRRTITVPADVGARMQQVGTTLVRCDASDAYLSRLAVVPEHAGRGAGAWLVQRAVEWAGEYGAARLLLDVSEDNSRAIAFYHRHGFVELGRASTRDETRQQAVAHVHLALALR